MRPQTQDDFPKCCSSSIQPSCRGSASPIGLAAYRDAQHPAECLIEARVRLPDRSWPDLGDIPVTLIVAGERREATTDAWGLASWEGVPIARLSELQVEVTL